MKAAQKQKTGKVPAKNNLKELRIKAALFDELITIIEDRYLGHLMEQTERERSVPLLRARKALG